MDESNLKYGVTGPVSTKESSDDSVKESENLQQYLKNSDFFESEESAQNRERVLGQLDFMVKEFVKSTSSDNSKKYGGMVFTFGSYRLGVHDKGADIDTLCVVPRHVYRKDFFTIFYKILEENENVTDLSKIEDAYVPLIKMKFDNILIDMTFARLNMSVVSPNVNLLNDNILRMMDEKCIVSLNGSRVTDFMLQLVPTTKVFHEALRAIKFWAKKRYIYGAAYGYFGGVAFSISVARVCQMYPNFCAFDIVKKYFEVYLDWKWPTPVILKPIIDLNYNFKVWDSKVYPADKYHKMPVITPAYPSMCSTHNIIQSTYNTILQEYQRSVNLIKSNEFYKIFETSDFFKKYKLYIQITIETTNKEEMIPWSGFIESKIRILATKLELIENISNAIPFPKSFKNCRIEDEANDKDEANEESKKIKLDTADNSKINFINNNKLDVDNCIKSDFAEVNGEKNLEGGTIPVVVYFIALEISSSKSNKVLYIDTPIKEFLDFVNVWDNKTSNMKIKISVEKKKSVQSLLKRIL